jgi:hypothetical protein
MDIITKDEDQVMPPPIFLECLNNLRRHYNLHDEEEVGQCKMCMQFRCLNMLNSWYLQEFVKQKSRTRILAISKPQCGEECGCLIHFFKYIVGYDHDKIVVLNDSITDHQSTSNMNRREALAVFKDYPRRLSGPVRDTGSRKNALVVIEYPLKKVLASNGINKPFLNIQLGKTSHVVSSIDECSNLVMIMETPDIAKMYADERFSEDCIFIPISDVCLSDVYINNVSLTD